MASGGSDNARTRLTFAEQTALASANALLIDWTFDALEDLQRGQPLDRLEIMPFLPAAYRAAYSVAFFRRFLVCLAGVGLKLRPPEKMALISTAEELALLTMTTVAAELLETSCDAPRFAAWFAAVCPHPRVTDLYSEPAVRQRSRKTLAQRQDAVDRWFLPFAPGQPLSPYLEPDPAD